MTMGSGKSTLLALLIIIGMSQSARAAVFTVGGRTGWTLGITSTFYDDWAEPLTFRIGDTLEFPYPGTTHDVYEVSAADLSSCNVAAPLNTYLTAGGASVPLTRTGAHYFICSIPGHCVANMKVTILVTAAVTPSAAPALNATAPALAPIASTPATLTAAPVPVPEAGPYTAARARGDVKNGASSHRSGPAMISGAIVCVFAALLLQ